KMIFEANEGESAFMRQSPGLEELRTAAMSPAMQWQRQQWLQLLEPLNERLLETMLWLKQASQADQRINRLRTHPGVGLLTALCVVHSLEPVSRFANTRKVTAYAGLDPLERSSAERQRFLRISKGGSRVLRFLLVEAAHIAIRKDATLGRFYRQLA